MSSRLPEDWRPTSSRLRHTFEERLVRPLALSTIVRRTDNFRGVRWLGRPVWQNVTDAWLLQETVVEREVDLVIECGTNLGGSAFYMATIMDALGTGHVVTIDITPRIDWTHPRITFLTGNSVDEKIVERVRAIVKEHTPKCVMVLLDSDHSAAHVLAEMKTFGDFVTPGSYMFVQDGCIDELPSMLGIDGPGPLAAIEQFLQDDKRFEVDRERSERYLVTHNPSGWLQRVR